MFWQSLSLCKAVVMRIIIITLLSILCSLNLYGNDLIFFELTGPVSSLTVNTGVYKVKFFFTPDGLLYDSTLPFSFCRDQNDNLQPSSENIEVIYNEKKQAIKSTQIFSDGVYERLYFYNNKGHAVRQVQNIIQSGVVTQVVHKIIYNKFDSYGNFIMRTFIDVKTGEKYLETRVIEYFD